MNEIEKLPKKKSPVRKIILELLASAFWLCTVVKLFIFDFDSYLVNQFVPQYTWLLDYKFFFLLLIVSLLWISISTKKFISTFLFVLFYPFYLFCWRIPKMLFKSWLGIFGTIGFIITFFKSLKSNFISFTLFMISSALIASVNNPYLLWFSITFLFLYLVFHFAKRFYYAFAPSKLFSIQKDAISTFWQKHQAKFAVPEVLINTSFDELNPEQKSMWSSRLQVLLILNRICSIVANKLKEFQQSHITSIYFLISLLFTFVLCIVVFSFVNFGLYKIRTDNFFISGHTGFFSFVYYSINTILTNGIPDFYPVSTLARLINTLELLSSPVIGIILFFVLINVRNEKVRTEIVSIAQSVESQGRELELLIDREFDQSLEQAKAELEKVKDSSLKLVLFLTKRIR